MTANGHKRSFRGDDDVINFIVVMVTHLGKFTKNSFHCLCKMRELVVYKLDLNSYSKLFKNQGKYIF